MHVQQRIQATVLSLGLLSFGSAHATACPSGIFCDQVAVQATTQQLSDGTWQYDYTFSRLHYPYNGGLAPVTPIYLPTKLIEMQLPYFADGGITDLKVGSDFAGRLSVAIVDSPIGGATQSIVISAPPGQTTDVLQPATVISGVNSIVSFKSAYAPTAHGGVGVTVLNASDWRPSDFYEVKYRTDDELFPLGTYQHINRTFLPASPLAIANAVPEAGTWAMMALGLAGLAAMRMRRPRAEV